MSNIRTFVAVPVLQQVRQRAQTIIDRLRPSGADVKWVPAENLHITLSFLGDVDERNIAEVCRAATQATTGQADFTLVCRGVSAFPSTQRPRTIWIGIAQGSQQLCALQADIQQALVRLGYPAESRQFHPHLTIGRVRRSGPGLRQLSQQLQAMRDQEVGETYVDQVVVYSSQLMPDKPIYQALARIPLEGDHEG